LPQELLIAAGPGEWRAALLEDGVPVELFVERGDRGEAGSIHLGRVCRLAPALGAAFIDIGGDRPAFLPEREVVPRGRRLDEGDRLLVQIRREVQGGKAARVTTGVALRGKLIELRLGRPGIRGDDTLSSAERCKLAGILSDSPEREGWGLRTFQPAPIEAMVTEAAELLRGWDDIRQRASRLAPPTRLAPSATFAAALAGALRAAPERALIDDPAIILELRAAFPDAVMRHKPEAGWPVELGAVFDQALSEKVALSGGGSIHIETTRAAVLIDVDSGTPETGTPWRTALAVNLAAAGAIARHLRLRNLGGGIAIDFVGLDDRKLRDRTRDALAEALAPDPARPQILGWTRLGHLELVRPRRGRPLAEMLLEPRPGGALVKTVITVAHEALGALRREAGAQPGRRWRLTVAPEVAAALTGVAASAVRTLEERFGREIAIKADSNLARDRFQVAPV
jgi:ribonuclease G